MSAAIAPEQRLVTKVLAEQMAALSQQIGCFSMFDRLMACGDLLAVLASQIDRDSAAATTVAQIDKELDDLAFRQAQQQDLARQTADLVTQALRIQSTATLSLGQLKALYVSEQQHLLHEALVATDD
jgi:hypothetical protein